MLVPFWIVLAKNQKNWNFLEPSDDLSVNESNSIQTRTDRVKKEFIKNPPPLFSLRVLE